MDVNQEAAQSATAGKRARQTSKKRLSRRRIKVLQLLFGLLLAAVFLLRPVSSTRVSLDLYVSGLEWESADEPGKDPDWFGMTIAANDSVEFSQAPAHFVSNPTGGRFDTTGFLTLYPARPYAPVRVSKLVFPAGTHVRLAQPEANRLRLAVSAGPQSTATVPLSWRLSFLKKRYDNARTGRLDTLACGEAASDMPCELEMQKLLRPSTSYAFDFTRPHPWAAPARLMASTLTFTETNTAGTQAISSVLDGVVRILDTNDAPIKLTERDIVRVKFEHPVELFLKSTPQHLVVHVDGVASQIFCGPKIMGDDNDQRPLLIKHYYDQSPYITALLGLLIPALLTFYFEKK